MLTTMKLKNLSDRTIEAYITQVSKYSQLFGKSPDKLGEEEVRQYLLYLRDERKASYSGINIAYSALKYFYVNVLDREWNVAKVPRLNSRS
jgi:site-specific recombinase XerD